MELAAPADFRVVCKDGTSANFPGVGTEMYFNEEGTILYIVNDGEAYGSLGEKFSVSYAVDGIEVVEFAQLGKTYEAYDYAGAHIDVAIDSSDDTSYTEEKEEVINDEDEDDYDIE